MNLSAVSSDWASSIDAMAPDMSPMCWKSFGLKKWRFIFVELSARRQATERESRNAGDTRQRSDRWEAFAAPTGSETRLRADSSNVTWGSFAQWWFGNERAFNAKKHASEGSSGCWKMHIQLWRACLGKIATSDLQTNLNYGLVYFHMTRSRFRYRGVGRARRQMILE